MTPRRALVLLAALLALFVSVLTTPAVGSTGPDARGAASGYTPNPKEDAQNARLRAQLADALATTPRNGSRTAAVTYVYYNDSNAPSYQGEIANAASIWNSSVGNVRLVETSGSADLAYYEGNDPDGSYASTDGRGNGYVFLDYAQTDVYDAVRVTAHETGHVLGLPDTYAGPCSQLMSGGGPGPSCTNAYPDATERANVDAIWASLVARADLALAR